MNSQPTYTHSELADVVVALVLFTVFSLLAAWQIVELVRDTLGLGVIP